MKVKNNKKTTHSLSDYCSLYIDKFNAHQLTRSWQRKAAFAAATATVATGMFLGSSSASMAQDRFTCEPAFNRVPSAVPVTNPGGIVQNGGEARPHLVDYDGDGDFDLLVGEKKGNNLNFYQNTGTTATPIWSAPQTNPNGLAIPESGTSPAFVDIDGDGDMDAFLGTGKGGEGLAFLENIGTATAPNYATRIINPFGINATGDYYVVPTFADIDNDGDFDLITGEGTGNSIFYLNTGTATAPAFGPRQVNPFGGLVDVGFSAAASFADLDNDGDFDLMVGEDNGTFNYFENNGTITAPNYLAPVANPFDLTATDYAAPTFADLNGDGDLDMFVGDQAGNSIYFDNGGTATQADFLVLPYDLSSVNLGADPVLVDIDGDGDKDAFVGRQLNADLVFAENIGDAQTPLFNTATIVNPFGFIASPATYSSPAFTDLDNDGDYDLIVTNNTGNLFYYQNTGTSSAAIFAAPITNPFGLVGASAGGFASVSFVDMDNDGDMDITVGGVSGNTSYFENTGNINAPAFAAPVINPFGLVAVDAYSSPEFVDMDGDGDVDAFIGSGTSLFFFANNGTRQVPAFAAPQEVPLFGLSGLSGAGFVFNRPHLTDINGDNSIDLLVGRFTGSILAFENAKILPSLSPTISNETTDCDTNLLKAGLSHASTGTIVSWYDNANGALVGTGTTFNPETAPNASGEYFLRASTSEGCQATANLSAVQTIAPLDITLSGESGYNVATLNWELSCERPVLEYEVYGDPGQFGTYFLFGFSSTTSFEAVGLLNGEKVDFRVRPVYGSGNYGMYSNIVTVKPSIVLGEEDNKKAGFAFFPNPNNGEFNLRLQDGSNSATVNVTSLSGQRVYTTTLNATQTSINLGNIASGMYIVRVETNQGTYQQKVSVVR
ncbi:FG-GAP-like repeat-containing protein [Bernardetia sp. OM2101]|uniref:FG-GAP-like repeat-containing protein n=1 Tax=Bernardetia sp. OM2101 TaxID=3344876 RepID=UPI0035D12AC7